MKELIKEYSIALIIILSGIMIFSFLINIFEYEQDQVNEECESADDYSHYGAKWGEFPITYDYANKSDTPGFIINSVERAINIYNDLFDIELFIFDTSDPKLNIYYGLLDTNELEQELGIAYINATNNIIQEANVTFNSESNFVEMPFSCDFSGGIDLYDEIDIKSVALHELGHVLGLDHVYNPYSTMYYRIAGSFQQTLSEGEIIGLKTLYDDINSNYEE